MIHKLNLAVFQVITIVWEGNPPMSARPLKITSNTDNVAKL